MITIIGDEGSTAFDHSTRVSVSGVEYATTLLAATSVKFRLLAQPGVVQLLVMVAGGGNAMPFFQYDPDLVSVTGCLPTAGKQVGGEEGGGLVPHYHTVTLSHSHTVSLSRSLALTLSRCLALTLVLTLTLVQCLALTV